MTAFSNIPQSDSGTHIKHIDVWKAARSRSRTFFLSRAWEPLCDALKCGRNNFERESWSGECAQQNYHAWTACADKSICCWRMELPEEALRASPQESTYEMKRSYVWMRNASRSDEGVLNMLVGWPVICTKRSRELFADAECCTSLSLLWIKALERGKTWVLRPKSTLVLHQNGIFSTSNGISCKKNNTQQAKENMQYFVTLKGTACHLKINLDKLDWKQNIKNQSVGGCNNILASIL